METIRIAITPPPYWLPLWRVHAAGSIPRPYATGTSCSGNTAPDASPCWPRPSRLPVPGSLRDLQDFAAVGADGSFARVVVAGFGVDAVVERNNIQVLVRA